MDKTYLDFFNYYLQQFLTELINFFPATKPGILSNYRGLLEGRDMKNDAYVKYYMTKTSDCIVEIAKKDVSLFSRDQVVLVEGVNFHDLWSCSESNDVNRQAIWKYLQLLLLLGRRVIPSKKEIMDMLKQVGGTIDTPAATDLKKAEGDSLEDKEGAAGGISSILDMASNLGNLGSLVGGLTGGGEGLANLGNIVNTVSEGLKGFNFEEMAKSMAGATSPASEDSTATSNSASSEDSNDVGGSLFADLAKDVASTFEIPKPTEADTANPPDMSRAFQNFMSGDNPSKMMGLIGKYGARLQQDIAKGKLNPATLLQQASSLMGNAATRPQSTQEAAANGGTASPAGMAALDPSRGPSVAQLQEVAKSMGLDAAAMNRLKQATRGDSTRERLKAKLAAKNASQGSSSGN